MIDKLITSEYFDFQLKNKLFVWSCRSLTDILYWPQTAKIGFIECDSRKKEFWVKKWQAIDLNKINYEGNEKKGLYKQGIAIRLGKCRPV